MYNVYVCPCFGLIGQTSLCISFIINQNGFIKIYLFFVSEKTTTYHVIVKMYDI